MSRKFRIYNLQFTIKLILLFFTFAFLLFTFSSPAFAQSPTPSSLPSTIPPSASLGTGYTLSPIPSYIPPTSPIYTDLLVNNLFHTFSCLAVGQSIIGQPCLTYQVTKNAQGVIQSMPVLSKVNLNGGVLGSVTNLIGLVFENPPVRTADYLASIGQDFGIVKEAHAQVGGSGQAVLSPILSLWQVSRNISYILMIVIFVIIGLMVMFRNKINPQTVITAQAALPGLVIGLILITFSYFLAGLISDTAFVGTNVVGYYFAAAQNKTDDPERTNLVQTLSQKNVLILFGKLAGIVTQEQATNVVQSVYDSVNKDVKVTIAWFASFLAFQMAASVGGVFGPASAIVGPILGVVTGLISNRSPVQILGYVIPFIATFVLIYAMIKLLLRLISSYLTIIFLTITAPFQLLFSALPGRQGMATEWILNLLGNILIFPAVIAVFYFIAFILGPGIIPSDYPLKISQSNPIQNSSFIPAVYAQAPINFENTPTLPLFGYLNLDFIRILLAFGALVALPAIPDIIVKAIGKASQAGQLLGQEISGGVRSGQGYATQHTGRIPQAAQSIGTGITGESQYIFKGDKLVRETTKPGLWQVGGSVSKYIRGAGRSGGAGRT